MESSIHRVEQITKQVDYFNDKETPKEFTRTRYTIYSKGRIDTITLFSDKEIKIEELP